VTIKQETNYPWEANTRLLFDMDKPVAFTLYLRKPDWSGEEQGKTYQPVVGISKKPVVSVNGSQVSYKEADGYLVIDRSWKKGDQITYSFSMEPQLIRAHPSVSQDEGRLAIQRGPLVYCVEGTDNDSRAWNILLPEGTALSTAGKSINDETVVGLKAVVPVVTIDAQGTSLQTSKKEITAIPYYTWANRGKNEMQVWLPTRINDIKINYTP
jgi:DUF1680 family protein